MNSTHCALCHKKQNINTNVEFKDTFSICLFWFIAQETEMARDLKFPKNKIPAHCNTNRNWNAFTYSKYFRFVRLSHACALTMTQWHHESSKWSCGRNIKTCFVLWPRWPQGYTKKNVFGVPFLLYLAEAPVFAGSLSQHSLRVPQTVKGLEDIFFLIFLLPSQPTA